MTVVKHSNALLFYRWAIPISSSVTIYIFMVQINQTVINFFRVLIMNRKFKRTVVLTIHFENLWMYLVLKVTFFKCNNCSNLIYFLSQWFIYPDSPQCAYRSSHFPVLLLPFNLQMELALPVSPPPAHWWMSVPVWQLLQSLQELQQPASP